MPLRNRVDPFGEIHAVSARGMFTGNRGVIHDPATKTLLKRRWSTKAWIICVCAFRGLRREVMGRNAPSGNAGWTELFFLDEVTALAAGHRPCFYCQRQRAKEFAEAYADAFRIAGPRASEIDAKLHVERAASGGTLRTIASSEFEQLPDGAMLVQGDRPFAWRAGKLLPWQFAGYGAEFGRAEVGKEPFTLLTPATTLAVLRIGYRPVWHESARRSKHST